MFNEDELRVKIFNLIKEIDARIIEREELNRLIFLALFSKTHMFLIGKPGVGKTFLVEMLKYIIEDAKYFERLIMKHTKHFEIFGTVVETESGAVEYKSENTVIDSHIIFIDELFKGSSEILNSFLGITSNNRNFFMCRYWRS